MINVNWNSIKPLEKKGFALSTMALLCVIGFVLLIITISLNGAFSIFKILSSLLFTFIVGLVVHIESRMLQIYMLQTIFDVMLALSLIKTKGIVLFAITAILSIALIVLLIIEETMLNKNTQYNSPEPDRSDIFANKNVMFFAPHEDDEINLYGGIIEEYVKAGSDVKIVFSTNGDAYGIGKTRIREALSVAESYGIKKENIIFLGYSDSLKGSSSKHIYNCDDNEVCTSVKGYKSTYGIDTHDCFSNKAFTRKSIADDFKDVILKYMPDTIYCCDYDSHPDHRAISLFFEEALGETLKSSTGYSPRVFKGFAYSLAWMGKLDYYSLNSKSTNQWIVDDMMVETNVYRWDERLRLPVSKLNLSHIMQNTSSYKAMMKYSSQTATDHANGILNNDKVFWERRTDSALYNAEIIATSGDASHICLFKMVDSNDINDTSLMPNKNAWTADKNDDKRIIFLTLKNTKVFNEIVIYASPIPDNITLNATVKIGEYQFNTGRLKMGANTFSVPSIEADKIAIRIDDFEGECSILKLEAFEKPSKETAQIVKLVNSSGDFCYDYIIDSTGREEFGIYTYPDNAKDCFEFEASGGIDFDFSKDKIIVTCKDNEEGILSIRSMTNPLVYDEVKISNPNSELRSEIAKKQRLEQKLWTLPMQKDYYIGLIRRLGVYAKPQ